MSATIWSKHKKYQGFGRLQHPSKLIEQFVKPRIQPKHQQPWTLGAVSNPVKTLVSKHKTMAHT